MSEARYVAITSTGSECECDITYDSRSIVDTSAQCTSSMNRITGRSWLSASSSNTNSRFFLSCEADPASAATAAGGSDRDLKSVVCTYQAGAASIRIFLTTSARG